MNRLALIRSRLPAELLIKVRAIFALHSTVKCWSDLFDPYRPELHYMRGPGPRWREKYAVVPVRVPVERKGRR
jgi:hypothetical protein